MNLYSYEGPVMKFGVCITSLWKGTTHAISAEKARNNLAYQFKRSSGLEPHTRISLPGKIILERREESA